MTKPIVFVVSASFAAPAFAAEVRLPAYTREMLPNGVVLYLLPKAGVPLVSFRVTVQGGVESEPAGLAGISGFTAQLLTRGTARRTADRFSAEIDELAAAFTRRPTSRKSESPRNF